MNPHAHVRSLPPEGVHACLEAARRWHPMRRNLIAPLFAAAVISLALAATLAQAQTAVWPTKPVKIVVTFPPGGAPDTLARVLADKWSQSLGQPFTVDNKAGAGGNIGSDFVAKSPGDGTTLLVGTVGTHAINPALYPNIPYNNIKDFTPVSFLAATPNLLVVNNTVPAKTVKELIELARKTPLTFGSSGSGTSIHLSGELFNTMAGVHMQHIPYKGRAQAVPDLLGGRITMIFDNMPSALPLVKSGDVRAIAVTSATRSPAAPNIPSFTESGLPEVVATSWFGLSAPKDTSPEIINLLASALAKAVDDKAFQARMLADGAVARSMSSKDFADYIKRDNERWGKIVRESNIEAE